jgi:hypothetical protein
MRNLEKARLIELFKDAIKNDQRIAANDLMKVPTI